MHLLTSIDVIFWRLLTSIDVHGDAKMTLDVMLTFVNWRQKKSIDVNWCQLISFDVIDAWRSRYYIFTTFFDEFRCSRWKLSTFDEFWRFSTILKIFKIFKKFLDDIRHLNDVNRRQSSSNDVHLCHLRRSTSIVFKRRRFT